MQLGCARLSAEERLRCRRDGRCFYCGQLGYLVSACHVKGASPQKKNQLMVSQNIIPDNPAQLQLQVQFVSEHDSLLILIFIDSSSDANLINSSLIRSLGLKT